MLATDNLLGELMDHNFPRYPHDPCLNYGFQPWRTVGRLRRRKVVRLGTSTPSLCEPLGSKLRLHSFPILTLYTPYLVQIQRVNMIHHTPVLILATMCVGLTHPGSVGIAPT